uniref:DUF4249 domain-containing protein n=1 Tax=Prevotella sp. GTC17254 TaxID=3236794 RepID=A0AB33J0E7_9BACT
MMQKKFVQHTLIACITCLALMSMAGCRDEFHIDSSKTSSKLVAYVFPSTADTTYIRLWKSIPVGTQTSASTQQIDNANIQYRVNGAQRTVYPKGDGLYYAIGKQQPGDHIDIKVSANDLPDVASYGSIPQAVPIHADDIIYLSRIGEDDLQDTYYQVQAHFSDPEATTDYYAVRILAKDIAPAEKQGGNQELLDSAYFWANIDTKDEPLLNHISDLDNSLGFNNTFYRNFYIFDDQTINGQTHTLRLNILSYQTGMTAEPPTTRSFKVYLYKLSPEYYKFLKSLNELANNKLARYGLSQMRTSFTNVQGGFGVLGCYALSESEWMSVELDE